MFLVIILLLYFKNYFYLLQHIMWDSNEGVKSGTYMLESIKILETSS